MVNSDAPALLELAVVTQVAAGQGTRVNGEASALTAPQKVSQRNSLVAAEKQPMFQTGRSSGWRANLGSCYLPFLDLRGIVLIGVELSGANL